MTVIGPAHGGPLASQWARDITDAVNAGRVAWGVVAPPVALTATQAGITAITDVTGATATFTAQADRRYRVSASAMLLSSVANDIGRLMICLADNTILNFAQAKLDTTTTTAPTFHVAVDVTELSGATTLKLRASRHSGTGSVSVVGASTIPIRFVVEDVGPV